MVTASWLGAWVLMSLAMMLPTAARPARRLARGRPARGLEFLAAYALVWLAAAAMAFPVEMIVPWNGFTLMIGWVAVGAYLMLPATGRHLRACRLLAGNANPWWAGVRYGISCSVACLPLMIVAMATLHSTTLDTTITVVAMALLTLFIMWAKHPSVSWKHVRNSGIAIVATASLVFTLGLTGSNPAPHEEHKYNVVE